MRIKKTVLFFIFLLMAKGISAQTEAEESNLKAAFIYNFTRFIEWDSASVANEFIIGIVGPSAISKPLEEIAKARLVNNKKITIKYFTQKEEASACNLLFISKNAKVDLEDILTIVKGKNILVVGEKETYAKRGTAFNFVLVDDKLKFEANTKAIVGAGLRASAQLLKLAIIVN
jgi:hypothetical protein